MLSQTADIYVRLSEADRFKKNVTDESESIQNQKTMLINYCEQKGWKINAIYSDEDYSGADYNRPGWRAVLKDCEEGICNIVVCKTQSRFSRDMEMVERYIHGRFSEWGVRFVGVVDNADTNVKGNKKARQINGLINEWYLEDLSENIKSTLALKRKKGDFVGSFAPYGYLVDPDNKNHLIMDEPAANVVRRIFNLYIQGYGYIAIAKLLNNEGISPPCLRKKELGLKYYNGNHEKNSNLKNVWTESSVYTILRRKEYTGALVQGRQEVVNYKTGKRRKKAEEEWDIVENSHQPIISHKDFLRAQEVRLERSRGQKIPSGKCHSLARKVFCASCGNTMWKMSYKSASGRYNYLTCKTRKTADGVCDNQHSVRFEQLEQVVLREINKLLCEYYDISKIGKIPMPQIDMTPKKLILTEIAEIEQNIARNDNRIAKMYIDKLDGVITSEEFMTFRQKCVEESNKGLKKISLLRKRLIEFTDRDSSTDLQIKYRQIEELTFEIADLFIDKIFISNKKDDGKRKIVIEWKV